MHTNIDGLVRSYELGSLNRRQLLTALGVLVASAATPAAAQTEAGGLVRPLTLDHVALRVSDPVRTEAFYRTLFGFPPFQTLAGEKDRFDLKGGGYLSFQESDRPGAIDHFCVGVEEKVDVKELARALEAAGMETTVAGGTIVDPDGIRIQMAARRS